MTKYKKNIKITKVLSLLSVAATDVNIVKAGVLIGRGRSLFIVLSGRLERDWLRGTVQYNLVAVQ